jgi:hypothetical protein
MGGTVTGTPVSTPTITPGITTYRDLRYLFVARSGRYDLINSDYTDNGADFFFNEGQKMLDRMFGDGKAFARYPVSIAAGTIKVAVVGLRAVKEVWVADSTGMTELVKERLNTIKNYYSGKLSDEDRDTPAYYSPAMFRPYPDTLTTLSTAGMYDVEDLVLDDTHYTYDGIIIMPPSDGVYTLTIQGLFYSPTLSATLSGGVWTQTKSFWSQVHPGTLLLAALYKLEAFYRNREGMRDWMEALMVDVTGIDYDIVERDIAGVSLEMEG